MPSHTPKERAKRAQEARIGKPALRPRTGARGLSVSRGTSRRPLGSSHGPKKKKRR